MLARPAASPSPLAFGLALGLALGLTLGLSLPAEAAPPPTLKAVRLPHAPSIDGRVVGDSAWEGLAPAGGFTVLGKDQPAKAQTRVLVGFDDRALYLGFLCDEPAGAAIQAKPRPRDGQVYLDDSVEVFLAPDPSRPSVYYHFLLNAAGSVRDERGQDASWNTDWQHGVARRPGGWDAEIAIPWSSLPLTPATGETWRVNFARNCPAAGESSSWAPCKSGFHEPASFGSLTGLTADFAPAIRAGLRARIAALSAKVKAADAACPGSGLGHRAKAEFFIISDRLRDLDASVSSADRVGLTRDEGGIDAQAARLAGALRVAAEAKMADTALLYSRDDGWAVCVESPMDKIPAAANYDGTPTDQATVELARNEYEGVQLVVVPLGQALKGVTATASDLTGPAGARLPRGDLSLRRIAYVDVTQSSGGASLAPGLLPDPLVPLTPQDVADGSFLPVLLTVHAPSDQPPGDYEGTVVFTADGHQPWTVHLKVRVWSFTLPRASFLRTCFQLIPSYLTRYSDAWDGKTPPGWTVGSWTGADDKGRPNYYGEADFDHGVSRDHPHSGKYSAWLSCTGWHKGTNESPREAYMCSLDLKPGKYTLRLAYRTADAATQADCGESATGWQALPASTAWKTAERRFEVAKAGQVYVYLRLLSRGKVWFDDVSITGADGRQLAPNPGFEHIPANTLDSLLKAYRTDMLAHRACDMNVAAPKVTVAGDKVTIDWTDFDRRMARYIAEGQNAFNISWARVPGGWGKVGAWSDAKSKAICAEILRQTQAHLAAKGWLKLAYLYVIDEPSAAAFPGVKQVFGFVHKVAPGIKRLLTYGYGASKPLEPGHPRYADLAGYVDIDVPHIDCFEPIYLAKRRKAGDEIWTYVCISAQKPYLNCWGVDYPGADPRLLFWQLYQHDVTGFLYWAVDYWEKNPWKDPLTYPGGNSDGSLLYPGKTGPIDSLRWEAIRDGIEDYDYLTLARQRADALAAAGRTAEAKSLRALCNVDDVTTSWTSYNENPAVLMAHRDALGETLSEAMGDKAGGKAASAGEK